MRKCKLCKCPLTKSQQWRRPLQVYCSNHCRALGRGSTKKILYTCKHCGEQYKTYASQNTVFCSTQCYHKYRVGKPSNHTPSKHSFGKGGYRKDLEQYFRSRWEANFARLMKELQISYVYEPRAYILILADGVQSKYIPDFELENLFIEIKGYWRKGRREMERIQAFANQVDKDVVIIDSDIYRIIENIFSEAIPHWEHKNSS